jgi:hypothetical protein
VKEKHEKKREIKRCTADDVMLMLMLMLEPNRQLTAASIRPMTLYADVGNNKSMSNRLMTRMDQPHVSVTSIYCLLSHICLPNKWNVQPLALT